MIVYTTKRVYFIAKTIIYQCMERVRKNATCSKTKAELLSCRVRSVERFIRLTTVTTEECGRVQASFNSDGRITLRTTNGINVIPIQQRAGQTGSYIDIFNPELRFTPQYSKLVADFALYEKQVGTS